MNKNEKISKILKELGIPAHLLGYRYIRHAVDLCIENPDMIGYITGVYWELADKFNTTISKAEKAIKNAIETGWNRANIDFANELFGFSVDADRGNPSNSEFVATVADYILMTEDKGNSRKNT